VSPGDGLDAHVSQLTAVAGWTSLPGLHRLRARTLVMAGDADPIVPPVNARILAARIPDSELKIVHGAGHRLLLEHAQSLTAPAAHMAGSSLLAANMPKD
jgi:poly(3-hydroxyoctanoate) depolymerase